MSFKFLCPIFTELSKDSTKLSLVVMLCVDIIILMFFIWGLSILDTFMACQDLLWPFMKMCSLYEEFFNRLALIGVDIIWIFKSAN